MFLLDAVKLLSEGAVYIEPPVTDSHLLVEDCPVRAEEGILGEGAFSIASTDMEHLALGLWVSIVTSSSLVVTHEGSLRDRSKDRIVIPWYSRDCTL